MKKNRSLSLMQHLKSFVYAFNGLKVLMKEEVNARIHLIITIIVILAGFLFKISISEWLFISVSIGFVFVVEILNTAIENISDFISPEKNDKIKKIKDLSAAAVLISALTAVVVGLIVFLPRIIVLFC
jgi:diacylglycerol kinase